jgi:hypothetical protein
MGAKPDWSGDVKLTIERLKKPGLKFSFEQSAMLIDYLASKKVIPSTELRSHAKTIVTSGIIDFIRTILANVTTAIHGHGTVPDPGGWYFSDRVSNIEVYVLDRGFSAAWRKTRG